MIGTRVDRWDIAGNTHFLGYITRKFSLDSHAWGPPNSWIQAECTRIAVRHKNAWAQDMREGKGASDQGECIEYTLEEQKAAWIALMEQAEEAISAMRQKAAA